MENDWPPLKSCIQYKSDMLPPYLQNFDWEHDEGDETESETEYSMGEDGNPVPVRKRRYKPSSLRKFIKQVRESRGYDVDVTDLPLLMHNPFTRFCESAIRRNGEWVNASINLAINHINSKTGKVYKHVDTLKVVFAFRPRIFLLTFTAKATLGDGDGDDDAETFLASVFAPGCATEYYRVEECFLKPEGPAPWVYVDPVF